MNSSNLERAGCKTQRTVEEANNSDLSFTFVSPRVNERKRVSFANVLQKINTIKANSNYSLESCLNTKEKSSSALIGNSGRHLKQCVE